MPPGCLKDPVESLGCGGYRVELAEVVTPADVDGASHAAQREMDDLTETMSKQ